jgi:uncharacterized protein YbbC (DUF1343 family)
MQNLFLFLYFLLFPFFVFPAIVEPGIDRLFEPEHFSKIKGKRIALITNHTALSQSGASTLEILKAKAGPYRIVKLFAPEHGLKGQAWASEAIPDSQEENGIPVFSLHGKTRRPTEEMLKGVEAIVFDIQDIGSRSYTYATTLFYVMEEAAKRGIAVIVLDRPNPINGLVIDGPLMEERWRSFVGYLNVPYCHGMTIGELARYFNVEYAVGCNLHVVPMKGWKRRFTFSDTGLSWVPTSPNIPEKETPLYYPATGILGELGLVSIGIGYTLPFKLIGAPWIDGEKLSRALNALALEGIQFRPFYFRPFWGKFAQENCEGVILTITDPLKFKPVAVQFALIDTLKTLYPKQLKDAIRKTSLAQKEMFQKVTGTEVPWHLLMTKESKVSEANLKPAERKQFEEKRKKYLLYPD